MRLLVFILGALPMWGLSNSVRVTETTGAGQTNHPVTISRYFAKGEIPSSYACVQPFVDGVAAEAWQCEKKNTHSDGSLKWAIIGLKIPTLAADGTVEVDFRPSASTASEAGHTKADALADSGWNADMRFRFNSGTADEWDYTLDARTMLTALAENAVCADVADTTLRGLRTWINGPVATQWIVEDKCRTRTYDFGATAAADGTKWSTWASDLYRTLHPWFVLTAYWDYPSSGQVTVGVDYVVEQPWRSIYQNVKYRPRFRDQNLTHVVEERTLSDFDHWRQKTYFFRGWASTSIVPRTQIDHNLPYMIYSGVIPPFEMKPTGANDKLFDDATVDTVLAFYRNQYLSTYAGEPEPFQYARGDAACQSPYQTAYLCAGIWNKNWQMSGLSTTYLPIPESYVQWLYVMGSPHVTMARKLAFWDELVAGTADIAGSTMASSLLESAATTQKFCDQWCTTPSYQTQLAWGQPVSMVAYPAMNGTENAVGNWTSNGNRCPFTFLPATGGAIDATTTTIAVQNASTFTVPTYLHINETEVVQCTTLVGNVFSNCTRGQMGTTAASHPSNKPVGLWPCAAKKYSYVSMIDGVSPVAHAQAPWFIPALLTGHPYYHEQLMREGMTMAAIGNAGGNSIMTSRNGTDLWFPYMEYRGRPQGMKIFVQAWALSFGPVQEYLNFFLKRQVEIEEGRLNVPQGEASFYSDVAGSPYQKGRTVYLSGWGAVPVTQNPTNYAMTLPSAVTGAYTSANYPAMADLTVIHTLASWWMLDYSHRTNAYAISLGLDYFRPVARATNRVFQRSIQVAPFAIGDYVLAGSFLKPSVRKEVLSATHDAGRSKLVLDFAAPHGLTGLYSNATICCADPLWTGGWQTKAITNFGATMSVVDADTIEIPWSTAMTGTYNSDGSGCCSTARQKLHFSAFNSGDTSAFQGPPQSWAEFDELWPIEARTLGALHSSFESSPLADRVAHYYATTMWLASLGLWDKTLAPDLRKNHQKFRSVKRYWDRQFAVVGACGFANCGSPGVAFGWKEQIENVSAIPSHDKVLFRFQAPTADPARVAITTGDLFADSRDASDTLATCKGRDCYASLPASPSTTYRYRVSGGTNGVARLEGHVQTLGGAGGASSYALTLHAPQGRGITQVLVQNGLTDVYGVSQTAPCAASCVVTVSGYAGELHHVRWTWQTAGGGQVGEQGERILRIE